MLLRSQKHFIVESDSQSRHTASIFLRDLLAPWSALMLLTLVDQETSASVIDGRSRIETIIGGYKLNQAVQLFNEHYNLNTGIDPINLPSMGVHIQLAQIYPSLGDSSITIGNLANFQMHHEGDSSRIKGQFPRALTNARDHKPA